MRIVVIVLASLLVLLAVVWICGSIVPRGHVASRSIYLAGAKPDEVWKTLADFSEYGAWAPEVTGTKRLPDQNGNPVWSLEGKWAMPLELEVIEPPRMLVTRIADPKLPFGGTWTWEISPENEGTRIVVTEHGDIKSPIFRLLSRYVFGYTSTLDTYLKALAKRFGATATPTAPPGMA
jgi:hypothetical protein